ncbi:MAG: RNA polymerase sigma factor [Planctomycetota bacterium]|jgi:RNA polymerase sigma-70 factor (ECF subfamily)
MDIDSSRQGELDLMSRVAAGDPGSFRTLSETYQRTVLDLGLRFLHDRGEAEDLCQDVFLQAFQKAGTFRGQGPLRGWIFRIAVNLARNRLRKPPLRLTGGVNEISANGSPPSESLEKEERASAVRDAITSLPERQRLAVILLRYEGCSYKEIAEALGCRLAAVESLIHRAHQGLRKKLKKFLD